VCVRRGSGPSLLDEPAGLLAEKVLVGVGSMPRSSRDPSATIARHSRICDCFLLRSKGYSRSMCRNIRVLHNFDPPTTDDEVREAALQFVRKVSGSTRPSRANDEVFDRAVDEIALATRRLLDDLVTKAPPKSREIEAIKGRERHEKRMQREVRTRTALI
jgi:hypothetical protein